MEKIGFIQTTVCGLETKLFNELRDTLADEYLPLHIAKKEDLKLPVLAEKICDYFYEVELKTGKDFDRVIEKYTLDLDSIVSGRIAKKPKQKKNKPVPSTPRAREYYDRACYIRKHNRESKYWLLDYSRIMLCLYTSIIKNGYEEIEKFDLSMAVLDLPRIVEAMRVETLGKKKPRFDTADPYDSDRSTFILLCILFYYMKSREIVGEY